MAGKKEKVYHSLDGEVWKWGRGAQMVKESDCNAGDLGSIPGSVRSPKERNGYPLQYSCMENSMDRGAQQATIHGVAESDMTEQLTL